MADKYRPARSPGYSFDPRLPSRPDTRRGLSGEFTFRSAQTAEFAPQQPYSSPSRRPLRPRVGKPKPKGMCDRAILTALSDSLPEHVMGVADGSARFNPDHMSASVLDDAKDCQDEDAESVDDGHPTKKTRASGPSHADGDAVPKWSNPDPYTVVPPDGKAPQKRDFVKWIRQAKNAPLAVSDSTDAAAGNDDFISLDVGSAKSDAIFSGSLNQVAAPSSAPDSTPIPGADKVGPASLAQKRKRADPPGLILPEWYCPHGSAIDSTPWCARGEGPKDPMKRLHNEILDFCDYVKPTESEDEVRRQAILDCEQVLVQTLGPGRLYCFGSFGAKLHLPLADLDLVFVSPTFEEYGEQKYLGTSSMFNYVIRALQSHGLVQRGSVQAILRAKVPIIKFVDRVTQLHVDLSFERLDGVRAQATFSVWKTEYQDAIFLIPLVKQFLLMRGLNDVHSGGLGGFTIVCLVVSMFQLGQPAQTLADAFLHFLNLYGNLFSMDETVIWMAPPQYSVKQRFGVDGRMERPGRLSIVDPNDMTNNISGGSGKAMLAFNLFSQAHSVLRERLSDGSAAGCNGSILGSILGGNYSHYTQQRARLRRAASVGRGRSGR